MSREVNEIEQAVSRALRDSLEKLQRTADELGQSVNDLVAACASTRPANALPPMLRAQTAAASLAASLDVLSRFVTSTLQSAAPGITQPIFSSGQPTMELVELQPVAEVGEELSEAEPPPAKEPTIKEPPPSKEPPPATEPPPAEEPLPLQDPPPAEEPAIKEPPPAAEQVVTAIPLETVASLPASEVVEEPEIVMVEENGASLVGDVFPVSAEGFDVSALPAQEQELHRRANRVAKVSMQDIKLLRADDVRLGQEHHDLCMRLRDDLEKARKEYDRRFQTILGQPVDYFYDWLVAILANGDPQLLGEYPYPSSVVRH